MADPNHTDVCVQNLQMFVTYTVGLRAGGLNDLGLASFLRAVVINIVDAVVRLI